MQLGEDQHDWRWVVRLSNRARNVRFVHGLKSRADVLNAIIAKHIALLERIPSVAAAGSVHETENHKEILWIQNKVYILRRSNNRRWTSALRGSALVGAKFALDVSRLYFLDDATIRQVH